MPDFWEFPTVSMGLGPISAIYQAHFNRYLHHRQLVDTSASRVWCFVGDGEMDEPESIGALGVAGREHLDNLIFVVNCNLQRLDGPVRGNGKIIQELEAVFRGAGWNVIKVIWGSRWDELLARDVDGVLLDKMNTTVDGEFQKYATESGAYIREHFFGPDPRLRKLVEHLSDDELRSLPRGGHDYRKLYAAYKLATEQRGAPTVILAKTIKGWTLGPQIEARNATHQIKKMTKDQLRTLRDRLYLADEIPDAALEADAPPYYRPPEGSRGPRVPDGPAQDAGRLGALGGCVRPARVTLPDPKVFADLTAGSGKQAASTTMAFARLLRNLVRDPAFGPLVAPIVPDEARTFGLEPIIAEAKIYAPDGQRYAPVDADLPLQYAESTLGPAPPGGHHRGRGDGVASPPWRRRTPPGATRCCRSSSSTRCSASSGSATWPGPSATCAGRGILAGCTAGRTTLIGEGLQHDDGHSPLLASTNPAAAVYDPAFAYEVAVIVEDAINRMLGSRPRGPVLVPDPLQRELPDAGAARGTRAGDAVRTGHRPGPLPLRRAGGRRRWPGDGQPVLLRADVAGGDGGPPPAGRGVGGVGRRLVGHLVDVAAPATPSRSSGGTACTRTSRRARPYVTEALGRDRGPVVAVTDFMRAVPDQIARWVPRPFTSLGTDGFGRSDARDALRRHFEVDAAHVVVAVLAALAADGTVDRPRWRRPSSGSASTPTPPSPSPSDRPAERPPALGRPGASPETQFSGAPRRPGRRSA